MFCSSLSPENCWKDSTGSKVFVQTNNDQTDFKKQKNTQPKCKIREGIHLGYFEQPKWVVENCWLCIFLTLFHITVVVAVRS